MKDLAVEIALAPFTVYQLQDMIPAYGDSMAAVITYILQDYLTRNGEQIKAYVLHVNDLLGRMDAEQRAREQPAKRKRR